MSNILYGSDFEVRAVLDWEIAYLADPESDLGWLFFLEWANTESSGIPPLEGIPGREETIQRYEELTGWKVRNLLYNEVLACVRLGVTMFRMYKIIRKAGIPLPEDYELNNYVTQRLASLLGLPPP
jgi:aminoglycoside phosphotransferase (APT) family kinase protein